MNREPDQRNKMKGQEITINYESTCGFFAVPITDLGGRPFNVLLRVTSGVFPCVAALGFGGDEERDGGLHGDWLQVDEI